jgi:hypothetical protein
MGGKGTTDDFGEDARDEARLEVADGALEDERLDALVDGVDALEDGVESFIFFSMRPYPDDLVRLRGSFGGRATALEGPPHRGILTLSFGVVLSIKRSWSLLKPKSLQVT